MMEEMTLVLGRGRGRKRQEVVGKHYDGRDITECEGHPHKYFLRHGDRDWGRPVSIESRFVMVNFCGYFFTREPIDMTTDWLPVKDYWYSS